MFARKHAPPAAARQDTRAGLIDYILERGWVEQAAVDRARLLATRTRQPVEQTLNRMGALPDDALVEAYAHVSGCRVWSPDDDPVTGPLPDIQLTTEFLRQRRILPVWMTDQRIAVAMCDPLDDEALMGVAFATDRTVEIWIASPGDWRKTFDAAYGQVAVDSAPDERNLERELQSVAEVGTESDAARLLASLLEVAATRGASDIHVEPRRHDLRLRLRLDGRLQDFQVVSSDLAAPIVSRIKVLANLDLGERRLPQDGRATFVVEGRPLDVRVSTVPSIFGEAAVLRVLDRAGLKFDFEALGYVGAEAATLNRVAQAPHGIFLVTGPTGSGKTTTLYALLNSLQSSDRKILSVEDPIEFHFGHVVQTQVAPQIGLTFATALRAFLRQDPDIILVGEVRDSETAGVAVQAAMTGHLVLASIHANDAARVIPRLLDMDVAPYQLAAGLLGAAAQRLVRRLCPHCRKARPVSAAETGFIQATGFAAEVFEVFDPIGCAVCGGTGFKGRLALVESFLCDEETSGAIARSEPLDSLRTRLALAGASSMARDGCAKVAQGLTSFREVMAVLGT